MSSKRRLMAAGLTVVVLAALGACGGGGGGKDDDPWRDSTAGGGSSSDRYDEGGEAGETEPTTVTGLRDAVRHISMKKATATRPHMVRKCRSSKGSRKCTTVRSGTETYTRVIRQERWCVSLNDVDGDTSKDAVWYQVTHATYTEAAAANRLDKLKFTPTTTGC